MNTQETREAMSIEIDAQPTTNPLDVETALPSAIVRNWPDAMWGVRYARTESESGVVHFCTIGIICETNGFEWGEPDTTFAEGERRWPGHCASRSHAFVREVLGLGDNDVIELAGKNDTGGKAAAADYLASLGL